MSGPQPLSADRLEALLQQRGEMAQRPRPTPRQDTDDLEDATMTAIEDALEEAAALRAYESSRGFEVMRVRVIDGGRRVAMELR